MERNRPDNAEDLAAEQLSKRIRRGADSKLLNLFGEDRNGSDAASLAEIDSGRADLFDKGIFVKDEMPDIDADALELLAVTDHGETVYPAFQFNGSSLHPVAAEVNRIIKSRGEMLAWEHAFWWISNNGLLDGRTPFSALEAGEFDMLLEAVRREMNDETQ